MSKPGIRKGSTVKVEGYKSKYIVVNKLDKLIFMQLPDNRDNYPLIFLAEEFHYDRHMHCWKNYYSEYEVKP